MIHIISSQLNFDVLGWHHGLNVSAGGKCCINLYDLIEILYKKAIVSEYEEVCVLDGKFFGI